MNSSPAGPADAVLAEYADLTPLQIRITTHRRYSEHPESPDTAVRDLLRLPSDRDLIDIGCGTGTFLHALAPTHHGRLVGIDTSHEAVRTTRTDRITAVLGSAEEIPFPDTHFDAATSRDVLFHVPDPARALTEARRVLRPGGTYAATVNHRDLLPRTLDLVRGVVQDARLTPTPPTTNHINSDTLPSLMRQVFGTARTVHFDNALLIPGPKPLTAFAGALLSFAGITPGTPERDQLTTEIAHRAERWFTDHPGQVWRDTKGWTLCSAPKK